MKVANLICLFLILSSIINGQGVFHKMYPGLNGDGMSHQMGFLQTNDSGFLWGNVGTLMKLDSAGTKEWRIFFDVPFNQLYVSTYSIIQDYNQGYLLGGYKLLISLQSNYALNWYREIVSNYYIFLLESKKVDSSNFLMAGAVVYNSVDIPCVLKLDSTGNILWTKLYTSLPIVEYFNSIEIGGIDGSFLACSNSKSVINPISGYDGVVFKLDSVGSVVWSKRYTDFGITTNFNSIKSTSDGNFILTGRRNLENLLMKINSNGDIIWCKSYAIGIYGIAFDVTCTLDNGFALVGDAVDTAFGGTAQSSFFIKTDSLGSVEWSRYMGGFGSVSASKIIQTIDGGYAIAGRRLAPPGDFILNLIKTDSLGHTGGCLEQDVNVLVTNWNDTIIDFVLNDSLITANTVPFSHVYPLIGTEVDLCNFQGYSENDYIFEFDVFPNPTNGTFNIRFAEAITQNASLGIFDLLGKNLYVIELSAGFKEYKVNFNPLQSGFYIIQLNIRGKSYFKKIIAFSD